MAPPAGDELLQHQPGAGLVAKPVEMLELLLIGDHRGAAKPAARGPRRGQLADHRVADRRCEFPRRAGRGGDGGSRAGHAQLQASLVQRILTGEPARQVAGRIREHEPLPQVTAVLGEEDRARVVGRDEDRGPADARGKTQQS